MNKIIQLLLVTMTILSLVACGSSNPDSNPDLDPCLGSSLLPGTVCEGGGIYFGSLSLGALNGSGTDHYMITPGGCKDIPPESASGRFGGKFLCIR